MDGLTRDKDRETEGKVEVEASNACCWTAGFEEKEYRASVLLAVTSQNKNMLTQSVREARTWWKLLPVDFNSSCELNVHIQSAGNIS